MSVPSVLLLCVQVNVAVHNTGTSAGRLLLAAEQIERGDLLANNAVHFCFCRATDVFAGECGCA
jgi:hypothetical protein